MMNMAKIAIATVSFLPAAALAAPPQMEPGLWQRTMTLQGRTISHQDCVTPEMVKQGVEKMMEARKGNEEMEKKCTHSGSWSGNVYSFSSECNLGEKVGVMKMSGTMTFDGPEHFTQVMHSTSMIQGQPHRTDMTIDHKRIGDCTK